MENKGLYTKENRSALFDVAKRIDSSARESYNSKKQWYILLYEDKPAENRASIWITSRHIRIYGGKYTPIFSKLPDEPEYKYIYKERRITFYNMDEALDFMKNTLCKRDIEANDSINTPVSPKSVSADGFVVICPRCDAKFKRAERCPECGQLIKYEDND